MTKAVTDYESVELSFSESKGSAVHARWERKKSGNNRSRRPLGNTGSNDRFIPNRSKMNMDLARHTLKSEQDGVDKNLADPQVDTYKEALSVALLGGNGSSRVLAYGEKAPEPKGDMVNNLNVLYSTSDGAMDRKRARNSKLVTRHIPTAPSRILDAPELLDDYYLNLLSWSDTNVLAVALSETVFLWNASSGDIVELCSVDGPAGAHISSVSWVQQGGCHLAVGTSTGKTQLWDVQACKQLRSMDGHSERVGSLSWNQHILSSGGRDAVVVNHDVRIGNHKIAVLTGHHQEVCQLAWSHDGKTLASGGNDNKLCLWSVSTSSTSNPRFHLNDHQAAVKALAWSPHERNLLASGGGTADRAIKFWNTQTGAMLNSIDTESQVCSLVWNPFEKEILSSHGFARNQLSLWKYPSMAKVQDLEGHSSRVLHLALSPDGGTVVSGAGDETLRFWDIFCSPSKGKSKKRTLSDGYGSQLPLSADFLRSMQIR